MLGLIVKYSDKIYKAGVSGEGITLISTVVRNTFIIETSSKSYPFVNIFLKFRENIEVEIEVAEFDEASTPLSENDNPGIIDPDYKKMIESESNEEWMLKRFHELETILKEKGELD